MKPLYQDDIECLEEIFNNDVNQITDVFFEEYFKHVQDSLFEFTKKNYGAEEAYKYENSLILNIRSVIEFSYISGYRRAGSLDVLLETEA